MIKCIQLSTAEKNFAFAFFVNDIFQTRVANIEYILSIGKRRLERWKRIYIEHDAGRRTVATVRRWSLLRFDFGSRRGRERVLLLDDRWRRLQSALQKSFFSIFFLHPNFLANNCFY